MDNRQLSYFRAVYENRSFTRAAESSYISPQGINKAIHQLEHELGVALFEQTSIGLMPTPYGDFLYAQSAPYVERHLQILTGIEELKSRNAMTITIRMAAGSHSRLPENFFTDFMFLHPDIHVNYFSFSDDECNRVLRTTNDSIGICFSSEEIEGYETVYTKKDRLFLIVGQKHPFARKESIFFRELKSQTLINHSFANTQSQLDRQCRQLGISPPIVLTPADRELTMSLVAHGFAVSFHAAEYYKKYPICRVDFKDFEHYMRWNIFVPKNKLDNPAVSCFIRYVRDRLAFGAPAPSTHSTPPLAAPPGSGRHAPRPLPGSARRRPL